jgi:hypothetical protein
VGIVTAAETSWPGVELHPLMRLRILAAALPGVAFEERTLDAPFDVVWSFISDLERSIPSFDPLVRSVRITERSADGERLRLRASPSPFPFQVELTEGFCLMRSAVFMVGMAAEPSGAGTTQFGHLEGIPTPGPRLLRALERPVVRGLRGVHQRNVHVDLDGIERSLAAERRWP